MRFKALIIAVKSRQNNTLLKSDLAHNKELDFMFFDEVAELPPRFDWSVYKTVVILPGRISNPLISFLDRLQIEDKGHFLHVVSKINRNRYFSDFEKYRQICLWEPSDALAAQIGYIIEHTRKQWAWLKTAEHQSKDYQETIRETPNALVIFNLKGVVTEANKAFLDLFEYKNEHVIGYPINKIIPDMSLEQLKSGDLTDSDKSGSLTNVTYLNSRGEFLPCYGKISLRNYNQEPSYILYISNQSDQYNLRRSLDKRNDLILSLSYVINQLSNSPEHSFSSSKLLDLLRRVFSCDYIFINEVKKNVRDGSYEIHCSGRHEAEKKLLSKFHDVIHSNFDTEELLTYHPNHLETLTSEKGLKIKTLITYPLKTGESILGVLNVFYLNYLEPDPFLNSFIKLIGKIIALSEGKARRIGTVGDSAPRFEAIIENALDGIYQTTPEGTFLFANPALVELLNYESIEDLMQLNITRDLYIDPKARDKFKSYIEKHGEVKNFVTELKTRDQKQITVLEQAHLVRTDQGKTYYEGFIRDITQFKQMEQQLQQSESFAEELIEQANFLIAVLNTNREIIVWNKRAEELTGYSRSEMLAKDLFSGKLITENNMLDLARKHLAARDTTPLEVTVTTKSGQTKIVSLMGGILHSLSQGETEVWFGTDITHLRELEEGVQEARKMERLNMILNRMTESLNHLLGQIQSEIRFFRDAEPESKKLENSMQRIEKSLADGIKLRNLIQGITDIPDEKTSILNPNTIIEEVVSILEQIKPQDVALQVDLKNSEFIEVEKSRLNQILMNLALNAFEAIENEGRLIIQTTSVKTEQDRYLKTLPDTASRYVRITVSDNGSGMDEATKKHALEPFFTTRKDSPVRGLGLTHAYQLITHYRGYLSIDSEAGAGTSVSVYMPVIHKDKDETRRMGTPAGKATVLVVDDEVIIRELLTDILQSRGYRVLTAENGREGVALYKKNKRIIDLIILDIIMPEMDGKQVYEQIKAEDPDARVLITSGYSKSKVRDELLQKGVDGFLPKPFDIEALIEQIQNIL